jgi:hypothetical protein
VKKPWVIGLLSVVPGLGLIVLGEVRQGLGVMAIMAFLAFLVEFAPWEIVNAASCVLGFAWVSQLYYAVIVAQRLAHVEAGVVLPARPLAPTPPGASLGERLLHKVRQSVMQQRLPGETLRVAIAGQVGPSFASAVLMGFGAGLVQHRLCGGFAPHESSTLARTLRACAFRTLNGGEQ